MRATFKTCVSVFAMSAAFAGANAAQAQDFTGLEEIFVTAQRRTENLQEVPITVNTLKGERMRDLFVSGEDIRALSARIPSLNIESSNGRVAPRFYIRGLGNTDFDLAASQPVSVIVDDVVLENVVLKSTPIFDVDRVEVLKGPQGTLFGRNTPAGIVKFTTRRPTFENEGYGSLSYGNRNTVTAEGAFSGPLVEDKVALRVSGLVQRRDNYIDNATTGEDNALGGFREFATRIQLLLKPTENLEALARFHYRDLEGTSAIFRANIYSPGSNDLNENFDRDTVFFDGGVEDGVSNPQAYSGWGSNLELSYDFGGITLTSITAFETTDGFSRGDIDGGTIDFSGEMPVSNPGFIPFPSDTRDDVDDLDQFTQELRLASDDDQALTWQVGFFYFDSDLQVTTDPGFQPASTVRQTNESWAVFGQVAYDITDDLTATAGIRYTEDDKELEALAANYVVAPISVGDEKVTWDVALNYQITETVNLYTRIARGFRAPSIQGRDIAFGNDFNPAQPTSATSETVMSYEAGAKTELFDNRLRLNVAAFYYKVKGLQLTAAGGEGNFIRLLNSEEGVGYGIEADATFFITEYLSGTLGFAWNETELNDEDLAVGICAQCTVTNPLNADGRALIDGNSFPQAPDYTLYATLNYEQPISDDGSVFFQTDWFLQGRTRFPLYESLEFFSKNTFEGGLKAGYRHQDGKYEFAVFARNVTNENNPKGAIDFNNLTGFVNEPRTFGVQFRANFN
ncbi:MAG: TonB-dependent receptor [Pseudomonadota bacterium]